MELDEGRNPVFAGSKMLPSRWTGAVMQFYYSNQAYRGNNPIKL